MCDDMKKGAYSIRPYNRIQLSSADDRSLGDCLACCFKANQVNARCRHRTIPADAVPSGDLLARDQRLDQLPAKVIFWGQDDLMGVGICPRMLRLWFKQ